MPIMPPIVHYFNNSISNIESYTQIVAHYDKQTLTCDIKKNIENVKIYQNKWIIQSKDLKTNFISDKNELEFSVARRFPNLKCESVLYDGLIYKSEHITESFYKIQNWPNMTPGVKTYTLSNISEFSINDYFEKTEKDSKYFCESSSNDEREKKLCSFINKQTGKFDDKNYNSENLNLILDREKFRILNLIIGIKNDKEIIINTSLKIILSKENILNRYSPIPPIIDIAEEQSILNLKCSTNKFLFFPNKTGVFWRMDGTKIEAVSSKILTNQYIQYGKKYTCTNDNGESEELYIDNKYLKINGEEKFIINDFDNEKILKYETNISLKDQNPEWKCEIKDKMKCDILDSKNNYVYIKIHDLNKLTEKYSSTEIKLSLKINNDIITKNITIYLNKHANNNINISKHLKLKYLKESDEYICQVPEEIKSLSEGNIYWFVNFNEKVDLRNKYKIKINNNYEYISCIYFSRKQNNNIIGISFYDSFNDINQSNINLVNIFNNSNMLLPKNNKKKTILDCLLANDKNEIISDKICEVNRNGEVYFKNSNYNMNQLREYIFNNKTIIDIFNLPILYLYVREINNNLVNFFRLNLKIIVPNEKPIIYESFLYQNSSNTNECLIFVKDIQNMNLSLLTYDSNNLKYKSIMPIESDELYHNFSLSDNLKNLILKENISIFNYKIHHSKKNCDFIIGNGTNLASYKTTIVNTKTEAFNILQNKIPSLLKNNNEYFFKNSKATKLILKKISDYVEPILTFKKSTSSSEQKPINVKFYIHNKRNYINILYDENLLLKNLTYPKTEIFENNTLNEISSHNIEENFFSVNLKKIGTNLAETKFLCQSTLIGTSNNEFQYEYRLFKNNVLEKVLNNNKNYLYFSINNLEKSDTVSCTIKSKNMVESAIFSEVDDSIYNSLCYLLDKNKSIVVFSCPNFSFLERNNLQWKKKMREHIASLFVNTTIFSHVYLIRWSESQRNKTSIIMNF